MSKMYFNKVGRFLFYLVIVVYLFGDLAIYAATVPKSMVSILCNNLTCVENMSLPTSNLSAPCTPGFESEFLSKHSRRDIYHLGMIKIITFWCPRTDSRWYGDPIYIRLGWIPRNLKPKLSFFAQITIMITLGWISRFLRNHPLY